MDHGHQSSAQHPGFHGEALTGKHWCSKDADVNLWPKGRLGDSQGTPTDLSDCSPIWNTEEADFAVLELEVCRGVLPAGKTTPNTHRASDTEGTLTAGDQVWSPRAELRSLGFTSQKRKQPGHKPAQPPTYHSRSVSTFVTVYLPKFPTAILSSPAV